MHQRRARFLRSLTAALGVACLASTATAQDTLERVEEEVDLAREAPTDRVSFSLNAQGTFDFASDLDEGDVGVSRAGTSLDVAFPVRRDTRLVFNANSEYSWYDFDDATGLVPGTDDLLDQANRFGFGVRAFIRANERWNIALGGDLQWSYEEDADVGEGFTGGGFGGASYGFDNGLRLGFAVIGSSRLEDDARVFPVPTLNWQIDERWSLNTTGPRLRLSYQHSDPLELFAVAGWESREYRLDEDSDAPGGVLRDDRVPIEIGAVWSPSRKVEISGSVGAIVYNEYEVLDSGGSEIGDDETDPHLRLRIGATFRF